MDRIRIFVASPSDVAEERLLANRVIERLGQEYADRAKIQAFLWEHEPLLATSDFQSQIGTPAQSDIFVLILWTRLGSPLGAQFTRSDGSAYTSATVYEFEKALAAYRATGRPKILVYRKLAQVEFAEDSATNHNEDVEHFFDQWFEDPDERSATAAFHTFSEPSRFEDLLEVHLRKLVQNHLPHPNNLPGSVNAFIGRAKLLSRVRDLLIDEETRLVTLVGPGGAGKTRLCLELGRELLSHFESGVFFVSLASVTDPELVPTAISNALNVEEPDELDGENVIKELKNEQMLLLIDNLEQVQSAGKFISAILEGCPGVKIIVTSREALRLRGAKTIGVPPLELPDLDALPLLADLQKFEAIRLFVLRAQASRDEFELSDSNARSVVEICRCVDALPLAIELAASRIRTMSPERLLLALNRRFSVLTGGAADLLDHQKSLHELIAWSYELLDESEQRLWRRLAVFADGCGIDAAQEVCDPDEEYVLEVDIETLVDKSLVSIEFDGRSVPRVRMLESLREFAREKLVGSADYAFIQQRFYEWCIKTGLADEGMSVSSEFAEHLNRIDTEQNNLRAALGHCLSEGKADIALRLCGSLYHFWYVRGLYHEGERWIRDSLDLDDGDITAERGRALKGLCVLFREQHRLEEAERCANEAFEIFSTLQDEEARAAVLAELGVIAVRRGDLETASDRLDECLILAEAGRTSDGSMSFYLNTRGVVEHLIGNLSAAKAFYTKGLSVGRGAGDKMRTATALLNLGEIVEAEGQHSEAHSLYRDSLRIWVELKHKEAIARCAEVLAGLEIRSKGNPSEAAFLFGAAEAIRQEIEVPVEPFNLVQMEDGPEPQVRDFSGATALLAR